MNVWGSVYWGCNFFNLLLKLTDQKRPKVTSAGPVLGTAGPN